MRPSRGVWLYAHFLICGTATVLPLAIAGPAQAWSNWSIGIGVGAPCYRPYRPYWGGYYYRPYYPVYVAPPPVVVAPSPYVVQPAPVVVQQPATVAPAPSYAPPPPPQPETAPPPQKAQSYAAPQPVSAPPPLTPVAAASMNGVPRQQEISRHLRSLADSNEGVRLDAVTQLGHMKAVRAIDPLAATLSGDKSPAVREAAARSLGLMRNPKALPALQRAVQVDPDHDVRRTAQFAIEIIQSR